MSLFTKILRTPEVMVDARRDHPFVAYGDLDFKVPVYQSGDVYARTMMDNEAAIRLYERFGFEVEGTLRQHAFRDGHYVDSKMMARLLPSSSAT